MTWLKYIAILLILPICKAHAIGLGCSINAGTMSFGTYNFLLSTPNDSSSTITVTCALVTAVTIKVSAGQSNSFSGRYLLNAAINSQLPYNLFTDTGRTVLLGDGTSGTNTLTSSSTLLLSGQTFTIYGRVPAKEIAVPGTYTDTMTVTLTY